METEIYSLSLETSWSLLPLVRKGHCVVEVRPSLWLVEEWDGDEKTLMSVHIISMACYRVGRSWLAVGWGLGSMGLVLVDGNT